MPASLTQAPLAREIPSDTTTSSTTPLSTETLSAPSKPHRSQQRLSEVLPPLLFGTATLNYQFNVDPYALHPNTLVSSALASGVRGFDTSPYYGPAEEILGKALHSSDVLEHPSLKGLCRQDYFILTKAGRIAGDVFDYSPSWIRHSVKRSLRRLGTTYLDVVYLHDVEFVSADEVVSAIRTLREIRHTTGTVHYVGICGYPVDVLTSLAELVLRETGEPLDIVQSYANFTIQNQRLQTEGLLRFVDAGVDVVPNASPLGMGLLRSQGVPVGAMGNWHPAPDALRSVCLDAAKFVEDQHSEKLETLAVRFAMESWLSIGSEVGSKGPVPKEVTTNQIRSERRKLGVNVMGVSKLSELADTMTVYNSIIAGSSHSNDQESQAQKVKVQEIAQHIRENILGKWTDGTWLSPDPGFINQRKVFGVSSSDQQEFDELCSPQGSNSETTTTVNTSEERDDDQDQEQERSLLELAVRQLKSLEKSVTTNTNEGIEDKIGGIEIEIEEKSGEVTPPPQQPQQQQQSQALVS